MQRPYRRGTLAGAALCILFVSAAVIYLVGFSGDLYGQSPEIQWLSYLRPEQKFLTLTDLQAAIAKDAVRAEEIFKNTIANGA